MACYHPLTGFRMLDGKVKFSENVGGSFLPDRQVTVPCGQCFGCRLDRSRVWATRCVHEAQFHKENSFLTLTYDDEHLPEYGGLDVKHWQNFAKQVRNKIGNFRYYHCGEYGGDTLRPHYHACIFGLDFNHDRKIVEMSGDFPLYKSDSLSACWPHGFVWIGAFTFETAAYVARYCMEKLTGEKAMEYGGIKPDYSTMSTRPGIGYHWYQKYGNQTHYMDTVWINGHNVPIPSYYDKLLEKKDPKRLEQIKKSRTEKAKGWKDDNTQERLKVREICARNQATWRSRHSGNEYIQTRMRTGIGIPGRPVEDYY